MSVTSKIEWTDATWTPIRARRKDTGKVGVACVKVSPACKNCYAERLNMRNLPAHGTGLPYTVEALGQVEIFLDKEMLFAPLKWKRPRKIFVCSQTDLFGEFVPDEMIDRVFAVMALCPQHTFQVLTKRAERMRRYQSQIRPISSVSTDVADLARHIGRIVWDPRGSERCNYYGCGDVGDVSNRRVWPGWPLPNVWLGVTAEDQQRADERIPHLLRTPAAKRFVSVEPMLGPLDLTSLSVHEHGDTEQWNSLDRSEARDAEIEGACSSVIDWVIVGGESGGAKSRPMHPYWVRTIRNHCVVAGVPFFFKQWGEWQNGSGFSAKAKTVLRDGRIVGDPKDCHIETQNNWAQLLPTMMLRVGKKAAGRLLDGREWGEFPV